MGSDPAAFIATLFGKNFSEIYSQELISKTENISNLKESFLDLHINVKQREIGTGLYDAFPLSIVRMPYQQNNMSFRIFDAVIGSEI